MLVLSRKEGERILIGDSVVVTVVRVSGDRVRIGIEAPRHVTVMREELLTNSLPSDALLSDRSQAPAPRLAVSTST